MARLSQAAQSLGRLRPTLPDARPDVVELHYIFLEADAGDPKINDDIWVNDADEQAIPLDLKSQLAENGLRVGKIGTRLSSGLLDLLETQKENYSGRRHHAVSGQLARIEMTDVRPTWNLFQVVDGKPIGDQLSEAQGFLFVTTTIQGETGVLLDIVPEIEFGPRVQKRVPAPDLAGWQLRTERDARKFPELRAKLELTSGEYAIMGTLADASATIGQKLFSKEIDGKPRQTLLLIRAVRPNRDELLTAGYDFDDFFLTPIRRSAQRANTPALETVLASKRLESVLVP
jgi:hypothetical protein